MKVKKYVVENISEAMEKIRTEFGDDAYILNTKKIKKGGFLGLGGKKYLEVTVLSEEEKKLPKQNNTPSFENEEKLYSLKGIVERNKRLDKRIAKERKQEIPTNTASYGNQLMELIKEQRKVSMTIDKDAKEYYDNKQIKKDEFQHFIKNSDNKIIEKKSKLETKKIETKSEISELKNMIQSLSKKINGKNDYYQEFFRTLKFNDISEKLAEEICNEVEDINFDENWKNNKLLKEKVQKKLLENLKIKNIPLKGRIILIGPTGVGKTTTLAKLAAIMKKEGKKVAIITIDTYRIAAADQLKIYADIMGIPAYVCYTPEDLKITLESLNMFDTVLIDTAGRSHKNSLQLNELKVFIDTINPEYRMLVASANMRTSDLINMYESFSPSNPDSIIITKIDETSYFGQMFSIINHSNLPISFITNGQKVPDDILIPDINYLVNKLIEGVFK
ncbi:flagellar biosynthesis regulator FlhF [Tepiditoga spiralis]|uniref:Flagellar biosynthesis protein FlhF n=1 Tax=Tepiditoga spiralis TaxID=2108365 RepID=A0A7G1G7W6_9BACT|nr:flagellar biosynthesis protein FlhF [Tepiditoga spiralis]BBE31304.1 flagellar biosynthesis regulator FlhF [Tepiditoga spiralis]